MMTEPAPNVCDISEKSQSKQSLGELLESFQVTDCLVKLIHQFLLYNEFESTADSLVHEAPKLGFDVFGEHLCTKDTISKDSCKTILSQFRAGDWKAFFDSWRNLIPLNIRETVEYKILTFKLHVHFAVLPIRIVHLQQHTDKSLEQTLDLQTIKILETAADKYLRGKEEIDEVGEKMMIEDMEQLRKYLEADGHELEERTELLPLFALPYLTDSHTHSSLAEVFELNWVDELTMNLQMFIMNRKQGQQTVSQKTSTATLISTSNKLCCTPLTEENLRNFDNDLLKQRKLRKLPSIQTDPPAIPLEITRSTIMGMIPHELGTDSLIIPNDRNIPMFTEEDEFQEHFDVFPKQRCNDIHSRSAQTRISSINTTTNFVLTSDLNQPASILNCGSFSSNHKAPFQFSQELSLTKSHLYNVHCNYQKLKLRFHKLHSDYHKLIGIAGELTAALENSVRGQAVDLQAMLESCIKIFPDLFNQNVRDNSELKSIMNSEVELDATNLAVKSPPALATSPLSPKFLDFKKIKLHLISGNVKAKLLLLQALRWKITLSQPGERDETVHEYLRGDLLGLHAQIASDSGKYILPYLLMPRDVATPHPLQQSAARLINALASLRCGRDYLAAGPTVLNVVIKCLNGGHDESIDAFTCDMMLAMLQKLSLRKQQRAYMIETGLVEWLIFHLRAESHKIGSYRLEYATALLMNLSLNKQAQLRAAMIAPLVISTLTTLLSTDHMPALPYVNGALNSFLSNREINEEAKKTGLASILEYHRKQNAGEIRKHLDHILKIHKRNYANDTEDEETADDDNEELDVLEDELEEGDPVKVHSGELSGEALLASCYSITPSIMRAGNLSANLSRPMTPKLHSRSNVIESPGQHKHRKHLNEVHQLPTHDRGFSPRLTPLRFISQKRDVVPLQPIKIPPGEKEQAFESPPSIMTLSPGRSKEEKIFERLSKENCPSLNEIASSTATDIKSYASSVTEINSEHEINPESKLSNPKTTLSPYFFSFTRTFEQTDVSDKSTKPTLKSDDSNVISETVTISESEKVNIPEKRRQNLRSPCEEKPKIPTLSNRFQRRVKTIQLNYSEEADTNDIPVCLYANQSSKDSSKTTMASTTTAGLSTCESEVTVTEKLSSIASLDNNGNNDKTAECLEHQKRNSPEKEEDAFVAKPKISRTPPQSAQPYSEDSRIHIKEYSRCISTE